MALSVNALLCLICFLICKRGILMPTEGGGEEQNRVFAALATWWATSNLTITVSDYSNAKGWMTTDKASSPRGTTESESCLPNLIYVTSKRWNSLTLNSHHPTDRCNHANTGLVPHLHLYQGQGRWFRAGNDAGLATVAKTGWGSSIYSQLRLAHNLDPGRMYRPESPSQGPGLAMEQVLEEMWLEYYRSCQISLKAYKSPDSPAKKRKKGDLGKFSGRLCLLIHYC